MFYKLLGDVEFQRHKQTPLSVLLKLRNASSPGDCISAAKAGLVERQAALQAAIKWYGRRLRVMPTSGGAWGDLAAALPLLKPETNPAITERWIHAGLRLQPDAVGLWVLLGRSAQRVRHQEYALCRALQLEPDHTEAWISLGQLYRRHGHGDLSRDALTQARIRDPTSSSVWVEMAQQEISPEVSMGNLLHAVQLGGSRATSQALCSMLLSQGMKFFKGPHKGPASNAVQSCLYMDPLDPAIWNANGLMLEERGNHTDAIFHFEMALALLKEKEGNEGWIEDVSTNLGRSLLKAAQVKRSIEVFEQLKSPNPSTRVGYAQALVKASLCLKFEMKGAQVERGEAAMEIVREIMEETNDVMLLMDCWQVSLEISFQHTETEATLEEMTQLLQCLLPKCSRADTDSILNDLVALYASSIPHQSSKDELDDRRERGSDAEGIT